MNLGIVAGMFNKEIVEKMLKTAERHCRERNIAVKNILEVPGSYDVPLAVKQLLSVPDIDAVAVFGAIVQGDTYHDVIIAESTAKTLQELSLQYNKPVSLGISGPRMTWEQGMQRAEAYAKRAVDAAVQMQKLQEDA